MRPSYLHVGGTTPLVGVTIDQRLREVVGAHGRRDAVVSLPQDARLSYEALDAAVERLARGLLGLGVAREDRVGVWSTNNVEWVLVQLATARIGAVLVNLNPGWRAAELDHALRLARVQTLFLIPEFRSSHYVGIVTELVPEALAHGPGRLRARRFPELRRLVVFEPRPGRAPARPGGAFQVWEDVVAAGADVGSDAVLGRSGALDADDPINIQFTSGTTGFPKAVVLTHHNILNNALAIGSVLGLCEEDRLCVPVPFYHCFGMVVSTLATLARGAALVLPAPHFEPGATLAAVESERCTVLHGVPTMFIEELEHEERPRRDLSSLRTGIMAGAPCPPELVRRVMEDLGCREILVGYGMTEASPVTHSTRPGDPVERRTGTVGINLPHQEVKVVDPSDGSIAVRGAQGEVCFRGYHVMRGYFDDPEATREAIDEAGWLHSGDLGVMDEDGWLTITGRLKDMIIRGGENVYPAEVEAVLYRHPDVVEAAVFGVPDAVMGEEVAAWVKLRSGGDADAAALEAFAREHLARFKVPRHWWTADEFPTTVTGKVQKFRLRDVCGEWLAGGAGAATPDNPWGARGPWTRP